MFYHPGWQDSTICGDLLYWHFPIYLLLSDGLWHVANIRIQTPEQSKQALSYFPINFGPEENLTSVNIQLERAIFLFRHHWFYNERLNSFLSEKRVWRLENVISSFSFVWNGQIRKILLKQGSEDLEMWFLRFVLFDFPVVENTMAKSDKSYWD